METCWKKVTFLFDRNQIEITVHKQHLFVLIFTQLKKWHFQLRAHSYQVAFIFTTTLGSYYFADGVPFFKAITQHTIRSAIHPFIFMATNLRYFVLLNYHFSRTKLESAQKDSFFPRHTVCSTELLPNIKLEWNGIAHQLKWRKNFFVRERRACASFYTE